MNVRKAFYGALQKELQPLAKTPDDVPDLYDNYDRSNGKGIVRFSKEAVGIPPETTVMEAQKIAEGYVRQYYVNPGLESFFIPRSDSLEQLLQSRLRE